MSDPFRILITDEEMENFECDPEWKGTTEYIHKEQLIEWLVSAHADDSTEQSYEVGFNAAIDAVIERLNNDT